MLQAGSQIRPNARSSGSLQAGMPPNGMQHRPAAPANTPEVYTSFFPASTLAAGHHASPASPLSLGQIEPLVRRLLSLAPTRGVRSVSRRSERRCPPACQYGHPLTSPEQPPSFGDRGLPTALTPLALASLARAVASLLVSPAAAPARPLAALLQSPLHGLHLSGQRLTKTTHTRQGPSAVAPRPAEGRDGQVPPRPHHHHPPC
jgi:hypothetical protein